MCGPSGTSFVFGGASIVFLIKCDLFDFSVRIHQNYFRSAGKAFDAFPIIFANLKSHPKQRDLQRTATRGVSLRATVCWKRPQAKTKTIDRKQITLASFRPEKRKKSYAFESLGRSPPRVFTIYRRRRSVDCIFHTLSRETRPSDSNNIPRVYGRNTRSERRAGIFRKNYVSIGFTHRLFLHQYTRPSTEMRTTKYSRRTMYLCIYSGGSWSPMERVRL